MYDVIIVGGGLSGLNIARLLNNRGKKIAILEKNTKLGGLIDTTEFVFNNKFSVNHRGSVVYGHQKNIIEILDKFVIDFEYIPYKNYLCELSSKDLRKILQKLEKYLNKDKRKLLSLNLMEIASHILLKKNILILESLYGKLNLINYYGAKALIEKELYNPGNKYFLKNGGSQLIERLYNIIKKDVVIIKKCTVSSFYKHGEHPLTKLYTLITNKGSYTCKKIVFAIPQKDLNKIENSFTKEEKFSFKSVSPLSLTKIVVQYNMSKKINCWLKTADLTSLSNNEMNISHINKDLGFICINYCDSYRSDTMGLLDKKNGKKILKRFLSEAFPYQKIDDPIFYKKTYYKDFLYSWKVGRNKLELSPKILHLRPHLFIIGSSFSFNQGWSKGVYKHQI